MRHRDHCTLNLQVIDVGIAEGKKNNSNPSEVNACMLSSCRRRSKCMNSCERTASLIKLKRKYTDNLQLHFVTLSEDKGTFLTMF